MRTDSGSNLLQINCALGNAESVRTVIECSPSKLDAAIYLGAELINSVLKQSCYKKLQTQNHEIANAIHHITKNFQTDSLVHEVSRRGRLNQLERLLEKKNTRDVEQIFREKDDRGKTPLMWASSNNCVDVIKFILSSGANLYERDSFGRTAFLHACRENTREVLEFLTRKGACIHDIDSEGQHGIHHAAQSNTRDVLELLTQELQADIHTQDWRNRLPIHHAAASGNTENVLFLIEKRSCLNSRTRVIKDCELDDDLRENYCGMTPLHYATQNGHVDIVRLLVQHGANVDAITDCGRTVLMLASENGHEDIASYFMEVFYWADLKLGCVNYNRNRTCSTFLNE